MTEASSPGVESAITPGVPSPSDPSTEPVSPSLESSDDPKPSATLPSVSSDVSFGSTAEPS